MSAGILLTGSDIPTRIGAGVIGNAIGWIMIALIAFGGYFELKEEIAKRGKLPPEQRRLQKIYARQRRRKWQPVAKRPSGTWARPPKNANSTQHELFKKDPHCEQLI